MGLKTSVWLLFFAVIFRGVPADANRDEGTKGFLDSTRETSVKGPQGGAVKLPAPPSLPLQAKSHPPRSSWIPLLVDEPTRINPPSKTQDSSRSGMKSPLNGMEKNVLRTVLYGSRSPTGEAEKPLWEHKPLIFNHPSSSTTEKVFLQDQPVVKEKEALLIFKVKTSELSQPLTGKITPGPSHKQTQEMGHVKSKGTVRGSTSIPIPVTPKVSENKTKTPEQEITTPYDGELVVLSLIDVPERDETTTCAPGERWHNNRCRSPIR